MTTCRHARHRAGGSFGGLTSRFSFVNGVSKETDPPRKHAAEMARTPKNEVAITTATRAEEDDPPPLSPKGLAAVMLISNSDRRWTVTPSAPSVSISLRVVQ
ncbi:MAG: hypothetical protein QOG97_2190 [Acidimicrobiaceae bacterium]|nr:hypothetical protein [Acidimicrobiaceae bacterium]